MEVLGRESTKNWLEIHRWQNVETPTYDADCQTTNKEVREMGCQTVSIDEAEEINQIRQKKRSTDGDGGVEGAP